MARNRRARASVPLGRVGRSNGQQVRPCVAVALRARPSGAVASEATPASAYYMLLAGKKNYGTWTAEIYTLEQQQRLGVDETGKKLSYE